VSETLVQNKTVRNAWLLVAGLAAVLLLVLVVNPLEPLFLQDATAHAAVGKPVPAAVLKPLVHATSPVDLADSKGRVLLVNLWGPWCPGCRMELPHLAALGKKYAARDDFQLVTLCLGVSATEDAEETRLAAADYLDQANLQIPVFGDPGGVATAALAQSGVFDEVFPTTFLVDRRGVVRGVWQGYAPGQEAKMERILTSLLVQR
jgi:thiol-disulfide isomerase/thioredoxin